MVRKLIDASYRAIETAPPEALEITALATEIAEGLPPARYGESTVARLRGHAWRERAYALYFTGSYNEAVWAVERSRAAFKECGYSEFDDARSAVVFALICASQEKFADGLTTAHEAERVFDSYSALLKVVAARRSQAAMLNMQHRYREALQVYRSLEAYELSAQDRAALWQNMAVCYQELGDFDAAARYFTIAIEACSKLGMLTLMAKTRWEFGLSLLAQGRSHVALDVLRHVRDELIVLNMAHDVAEVTTEIAHALIATGHIREVADECHRALSYFVSAGLATTEPAMSAISLLREAAIGGRLDEQSVRKIRTTVTQSRVSTLSLYAD
jgi:tetratricopeptide (TPR) repeat protein